MIIKGANVQINVADMDASIEFYESIGFKLVKRWGNEYTQLTVPDVKIGLYPTAPSKFSKSSGNVSIGLTTENLEAAKQLLDNNNIPYTEKIEDGGVFVHFMDPDGTLLYFIQIKW